MCCAGLSTRISNSCCVMSELSNLRPAHGCSWPHTPAVALELSRVLLCVCVCSGIEGSKTRQHTILEQLSSVSCCCCVWHYRCCSVSPCTLLLWMGGFSITGCWGGSRSYMLSSCWCPLPRPYEFWKAIVLWWCFFGLMWT